MFTYISHPVVAEQFHIGDIPKILKGEDGHPLVTCRFGSNKPMNIINEIVIVHDDETEVVVNPGDWIVRNVLGEFLVYEHDEFTREFSQVVA